MSEPTTQRAARRAARTSHQRTRCCCEKYAKGDERSVDDVRARVARALAAVEAPSARTQWEARFFEAQRSGFIPAGRINSAAGTALGATLINCFVQPVGDSIAEPTKTATPASTSRSPRRPRRCAAAAAWATTSRASGPRGAWVGSHAEQRVGPGVLHARVRPLLRDGGVAPARGAARRWACCAATIPTSRTSSTPRTTGDLTNFNISVGVTDAFMRAVRGTTARSSWCTAPSPARRRRPPAPTSATTACGSTASCARATLWDQIMRSTYDHAEPGVLFIDRINARQQPRATARRIDATNPCGEQPLPAYGCCCLGSIDLTRFVRRAVRGRRALRLRRLRRGGARSRCACSTTCSTSPCGRCRSSARRRCAKRRIGLGFTGLGDALVMLGLRYDTPSRARRWRARIAALMRDAAYDASVELARERGAFPLFNADLLPVARHASRRACRSR